jgi:Xaa-Pro aminopeptidase
VILQPPPEILAPRQTRLREVLAPLGVDRLLVTTLPNVAWLTGFDGSAAVALVRPHDIILVTDARYREAADEIAAGAGGLIATAFVDDTYDETIVRLIAGEGGPIGFEAGSMTVARLNWLTTTLERGGSRTSLTPTMTAVEACRSVKDAWEIGLLREGAQRLSAVAIGVLADIRPGLVERDIAQAIEGGLRRAGFSRPAFDTIVASGTRAALPHGRASDRVIQPREVVVLDFGGVYGGYCVDLTRTIACGDPGAEARDWYEGVRAAQAAAIAVIRPGRLATDVDHAARTVLDDRGLGHLFTHGTGHGLGLEVHEAPRVGRSRLESGREPMPGTVPIPEHLAAGMTLTVEPGVYVPGRGGVRIEDDVLVTASGVEVLTSVPRTLVID